MLGLLYVTTSCYSYWLRFEKNVYQQNQAYGRIFNIRNIMKIECTLGSNIGIVNVITVELDIFCK